MLLGEASGLTLALPILLLVPGKKGFLFRVWVVKEGGLFGRAGRESAEKRKHCEFQSKPITSCCQHRRQYLRVALGPRGPKCS